MAHSSVRRWVSQLNNPVTYGHFSQLMPVSKVPVELLSAIFLECVPTAPTVIKVHDNWSHKTFDSKWIAITEVCHQWRDVALSTPTLWTNISLTRPDGVKYMLEHSKTAPFNLFLEVYHNTEALFSCVELVMQHVERAFAIHLSYRYADSESERLAKTMVLSCRAPYLKELCLEGSRFVAHQEPFLSGLHLTTHHDYASRLRHLTLDMVPLPDVRSIIALESLTFHGTLVVQTQELLDTFRQLKNLRSLDLGLVEGDSGIITKPTTTLHIPSLTRFLFSGDNSICAALVPFISPSSQAHIEIRAGSFGVFTNLSRDYFGHNSKFSPPCTFAVHRDHGYFQIRGSSTDDELEGTIILKICRRIGNRDFRGLLSQLNLHGVRRLTVTERCSEAVLPYPGEEGGTSAVLFALSDLPQVETLELVGYGLLLAVARVLSPRVLDMSNGTRDASFPSLRRLNLNRRFYDNNAYDEERMFADTVECLVKRRQVEGLAKLVELVIPGYQEVSEHRLRELDSLRSPEGRLQLKIQISRI